MKTIILACSALAVICLGSACTTIEHEPATHTTTTTTEETTLRHPSASTTTEVRSY